MKTNPKRPSRDEFAKHNEKLKADLLTFASWFSLSFHDQTEDANENFEDSIIQTLALANMAMIEALSVNCGLRIEASRLLHPVIDHTLAHEEQQKNCPHNCGDHQ